MLKDFSKLEILKLIMLDNFKNSTKLSLKRFSQVENKMIKERNSKSIVRSDIIELLSNKVMKVMRMRKTMKMKIQIQLMNLMKMTMTTMMTILTTKKKKNSRFYMSLQLKIKLLIDSLMLFGNKNIMPKISKKKINKINSLLNKLLLLMFNYKKLKNRLGIINLKNSRNLINLMSLISCNFPKS